MSLAVKRVDRAVVLAAGLGTRLKWLTDSRPKALMPVAGAPAIVHVIRHLASQGIGDIAINTHHHARQLIDYLGDGAKWGVRLYFSHEPELLDSGGGVRKAMELLPEGGLLAVYNADVLANIDLQQLAACVPEGGAALALVPNPDHNRSGDFSLSRGAVRPLADEGYTFSGVSVWDGSALKSRPVGEPFKLTDPIRELITSQQMAGVVHRGGWFDIGRPRDLFRVGRGVNNMHGKLV